MAKRARKRNPSIVLGIALLFLFGVIAYYGVTRLGWRVNNPQPQPANVETKSTVDPAAEGRRVTVSGKLSAPSAVRDEQLGLSVDTVVLLRNVEMYQWREECAGSDCKYDTVWSSTPIDASKFHTPAGHENPHFPLSSARFATGPVHLGGYQIDPDLLVQQIQPEKYAVHASDLPPNLGVTFREADGVLFTGDDLAHPKVGALRVSYRALPSHAVSLTGVQHGQRLSVD
jgi:Transmembrane protein 43